MSWNTLKPGAREIATARKHMDWARWAQNDAIWRAQRGFALGEYHLTAHERPIVEALIALLRWLHETPK